MVRIMKHGIRNMILDTFELVQEEEKSLIGLSEKGKHFLDHNERGNINYNKQILFLYIAKKKGGFLNIFYSIWDEKPLDFERVMEKVNKEREEVGFPPRKRRADLQKRLKWLKELGLCIENDEIEYSISRKGKKLLDRILGNGEDGKKARVSEPETTLNQMPEKFRDRIDVKLSERRFGIRVDDEVVVYIVGGDTLRVVKGKVLDHKRGLHILDEDGYYHRISYDWVTDILVKKHNRPYPKDDKEIRRKKKKREPEKPKEKPKDPFGYM